MNVVLIYGPPGVGKLTVATELAKLTGYKLFDNHASIDVIRRVFDFNDEPFWPLVNRLRLDVLDAAASHGVDLISTSVYDHTKDEPLIMSRFEAVEGQGGRICLVRLHCSLEELDRRIESESRIEIGKLANAEAFHKSTKMENVTTPIPGRESLSIDNTDVAPDEVARRIVEHYGLLKTP